MSPLIKVGSFIRFETPKLSSSWSNGIYYVKDINEDLVLIGPYGEVHTGKENPYIFPYKDMEELTALLTKLIK